MTTYEEEVRKHLNTAENAALELENLAREHSEVFERMYELLKTKSKALEEAKKLVPQTNGKVSSDGGVFTASSYNAGGNQLDLAKAIEEHGTGWFAECVEAITVNTHKMDVIGESWINGYVLSKQNISARVMTQKDTKVMLEKMEEADKLLRDIHYQRMKGSQPQQE